ncbi:hypothetical protein VTI74DRAFT_9174 [Chaetomium olivicolor]
MPSDGSKPGDVGHHPVSRLNKLPVEVRLTIIRLLRENGGRAALARAYPEWKRFIKHEDKFRVLTLDLSGEDRLTSKSCATSSRETCCASIFEAKLTDLTFAIAFRNILEALGGLDEQFRQGTSRYPLPVSLSLVDCQDFMTSDRPGSCSRRRHSHREAKGDRVDELRFRSRGVFRNLDHKGFWPQLWKHLSDLRVIDLEFDEKMRWQRKGKAGGNLAIAPLAQALTQMRSTLPLEEFPAHLGRNSPLNELRPNTRRPISDNPFPALVKFYLGIGPDRSEGDWLFVKYETDETWQVPFLPFTPLAEFTTQLATLCKYMTETDTTLQGQSFRGPQMDELRRAHQPGHLPTGPLPEYEQDSDDDGYYDSMQAKLDNEMDSLKEEHVKRNHEKIETFEVGLNENFDEDDPKSPIVPPFTSRTFKMLFAKKVERKDHPRRLADDVLSVWKTVVDKDLEISFEE